jgi:hypothetical protein
MQVVLLCLACGRMSSLHPKLMEQLAKLETYKKCALTSQSGRHFNYSFMLFMNTDNFKWPEEFAPYFVCLVLMKKKIIFLSNFRVYVCRRFILWCR